MKILIVNPPIREWSEPNVFPLGLGYIAAVLQKEGHEVDVMDINAYRWSKKEVEDKIKTVEVDVVAIGGIITVYKYIKWFVDIFKNYHPDAKIIVGGPAGSSIPKIVLENNPVEVVNIGEGEETIKELVYTFEHNLDLSNVNGIWYKDENGNIVQNELRKPIDNLDEIPLPAWDLFPMEIYLENPIGAINQNKWIDGSGNDEVPFSMNICASRGCPYKCIYCYHDFMGYTYRHRSAKNVMDEIKILYHRYGVKYFHFIDDEFVMDVKFAYEFCNRFKDFMNEVGEHISWGSSGRVNLMTEDMIATMADSGCELIGYGIESGSQTILNSIKKQVTVEQAKNAILFTNKHLGWAGASFMIGYPEETRETIQETIDFCKEVDLTPEVIFFLTAYPGTELYNIALGEGKIKDEEEYILSLGEQGERVQINFTDFSDDELMQIQKEMIDELNAWNKVKHIENNA